ncbi:MAG: acyloxyacyl hydrolase [Bacteroidota bacterium]
MEQREEFTEKRKYREYALNLGLTFRHKTYRNLSTYAMGSVGPMYSNTGSERLKEGFAFSDIFAIGFSYNIKSFLIDLRFSIRHVSNADLQWPNIGHNSSNLEFGFMYQL